MKKLIVAVMAFVCVVFSGKVFAADLVLLRDIKVVKQGYPVYVVEAGRHEIKPKLSANRRIETVNVGRSMALVSLFPHSEMGERVRYPIIWAICTTTKASCQKVDCLRECYDRHVKR